jgi:hypothetical protein
LTNKNGAVVEFLVAGQSFRVHPAWELCLIDGLQDKRLPSIGKGDEKTDVFFNVSAENGQYRVKNVFLRSC